MDRAQQLIHSLGLQVHPEGGCYRRLYAAGQKLDTGDSRGERLALTAILFLLRDAEHSRWHRLLSDEVWTWIEGAPLELRTFDPEARLTAEIVLAAPGRGQCLHGVAGGHWQSARSTGPYTLVSCAVAPGFDFADFAFLGDHPRTAAALGNLQPDWLRWL